MDARSIIDKAIDGEVLLRYYGFNGINAKDTTIRSCCKIHDGDNDHGFIYNIESNMWHCCTGECGGGDAYELVKRFEDVTYPQAIMKMAEIFHVDISNLELTTIKSANKKERDEWLMLIEKAKPSSIKEFIPPELEIKNITHFRNYTAETIHHFKAFYTPRYDVLTLNHEYYLLNRICIPVTFRERLVGYALRRVNNEDIQKWSNQGFNSRDILYNYDKCFDYLCDNRDVDEVILVEGIFDVWQYWQQGIYNVVATFGAHITEEQIELLQGMCSTLILSYDADKAGRACTSKSIKDLKYMFDLYVIPFNEGDDPGSCEELVEKYKNKIFHTRWC